MEWSADWWSVRPPHSKRPRHYPPVSTASRSGHSAVVIECLLELPVQCARCELVCSDIHTHRLCMMSQSLIRIRAEDDAADLVLKQSTIPALQCATTSAALTSTAPTSSASSAMDSMWSEYEQYLQAARAAQEAGIDIFPQAAFVVKVSLLSDTQKGRATKVRKDLLEEDERGDSESDKLFINVCTDACVDAPEIVRQPADVPALPPSVTSATPTSSAAAPPPGSLRLPMSVGPLNPCKSRSGAPSLSVDVVIHPSTLIQPLDAAHSQAAYQYAIAQAALIQRQSGTAPPVLTPAQQQAMAMREVKRTVAAFALQRIEEKYKLRVDEQAELKFPKAAYRGSLPPAAQRIRRNKDNPLHAMTPQQREEVGKRGKVLVQEVTLPPQNKPAASTAAATTIPSEATTAPGKETILSSSVKQPSESGNASAQADSHGKQRVERQERVTEGSGQTKQEVRAEQSTNMAEQNTTGQKPASVTPAYTLDTEGGQLTLQVQLPGVVSTSTTSASHCCRHFCVPRWLTTSPLSACLLSCSRRVPRWTPLSHPPTFASQHRRRLIDPPISCTLYCLKQWTTSAYRPSSTRRSASSRSPCRFCPSRTQQYPTHAATTQVPQQWR